MSGLSLQEKKNLHAWCMYDWSTNGYQLTTVSVLLPTFFVSGIAPEGVTLLGYQIPALSLWSFALGLAAMVVLVLSPILGAVADYTSLRKEFLTVFACGGSFFASILFFAQPGTVWFALFFFVLAQICYTSGNVFYDSFLPQLVPDDYVDKASGRGFAYGYMGGALQFMISLGLVSFPEKLGISLIMATRLSLLTAGLWWIGFAAYALTRLRDDVPADGSRASWKDVPGALSVGVRRTWAVFRRLPKFPWLLLFLIAFLIYNDGIQTVIGVAAAYVGAELKLSTQVIMLTFLAVQFVAFGGALFFGHLAGWIGTKRAILAALAIWTAVVAYGYRLEAGDVGGFFMMGLIIGLVLGGSQALSRSLFASMIPREAAAGFFGFYSVFNKLSAISGPFLFGFLTLSFGSGRPAILALAGYFLLGGTLLACVDVKKARAARSLWQFDKDHVSLERDPAELKPGNS